MRNSTSCHSTPACRVEEVETSKGVGLAVMTAAEEPASSSNVHRWRRRRCWTCMAMDAFVQLIHSPCSRANLLPFCRPLRWTRRGRTRRRRRKRCPWPRHRPHRLSHRKDRGKAFRCRPPLPTPAIPPWVMRPALSPPPHRRPSSRSTATWPTASPHCLRRKHRPHASCSSRRHACPTPLRSGRASTLPADDGADADDAAHAIRGAVPVHQSDDVRASVCFFTRSPRSRRRLAPFQALPTEAKARPLPAPRPSPAR